MRIISFTVALLIGAISANYQYAYINDYPSVESGVFRAIGKGFEKAEPYLLPAAAIGATVLGGVSV